MPSVLVMEHRGGRGCPGDPGGWSYSRSIVKQTKELLGRTTVLMSTDTREERLARRIADLYANDQQFADARPSEEIATAIDQPGLRLPQIVRTVMEGYADRPALAQ